MACLFNVAIQTIVLTYLSYRLINAIYNLIYPFFIAIPKDLSQLMGAKWAVITGSTDGIGRAYAEQLANRGYHCLLVSRSEQKLKEQAEKMRRDYGVQVEYVIFDFGTSDVKKYEKEVQIRLQQIDVGILVNNVGISNDLDILHKYEGGLQEIADVVVVNTLPVTMMTALVLPQMVARNRGVIVNLSSTASYVTLPQLAVYSSAKKYMNSLTETLRQEYAQYDIIFQCICPGFVATKMSKIRQTSFFVPSPESFVKSALRTIGLVDETTEYGDDAAQLYTKADYCQKFDSSRLLKKVITIGE